MVSAATMLARAEPQMPTRPLVHLVAAVALPAGRTCRYGEHVTGRQIEVADTGVPQGDPQWVLDRRMQPDDLLTKTGMSLGFSRSFPANPSTPSLRVYFG